MMDRRSFLKGSMTTLAMAALPSMARAKPSSSIGHVVIIGAGFGGATAAKYLRMWSEGKVKITLIEPRRQFISCPVSNRIFAGVMGMESITHSYDHLRDRSGIRMIHSLVTRIDPERRTVVMGDEKITYDRLILATGVDFDYSHLPMLNAELQATDIPHAWKAGPQTTLLKKQIEALPEGGVVAITIPPVPYRCPPGPYERACQIAYYLKRHKPRSKLLVLDANPAITSKRPLFERAWKDLYADIIEYQPSNPIENLDVKTRTVTTTFDRYKADVLNVIPPQTAGRLALATGLASRATSLAFMCWATRSIAHFPSPPISQPPKPRYALPPSLQNSPGSPWINSPFLPTPATATSMTNRRCM
jgi:sulfide dehydrogenase [flavocytochrome c] flavoprotein subunit